MKTENIQPLRILPKREESPIFEDSIHDGSILDSMAWTSGDELHVLYDHAKGPHRLTLRWCRKGEGQIYRITHDFGRLTPKDLRELASRLAECADIAEDCLMGSEEVAE